MTHFRPFLLALAAAALISLPCARAAIVTSGDIEPTIAPDGWEYFTDVYVGNTTDGSLIVDQGSGLDSQNAYLAYGSSVTGSASVRGAKSQWRLNVDLYAGYAGNGLLNIEAGGQVVTYGSSYLGYNSGASGTVLVSGAGSTWTNNSGLYVGRSGSGALTVSDGGLVTAKTLYSSLNSLLGNGTITTSGAVLDADLTFDGLHGTTQTIAFGNGGRLNVTVTAASILGAGYVGIGNLSITDGVTVASGNGYLGYSTGSSGTATVNGTGSKWTNSSGLYVGYGGNGALTVSDGGLVAAQTLYATPSDLLGNGTITANGAILDANLVFDSAHGTTQDISFGTGGTLNLVTNGSGNLGAGYKNTGSLNVCDGLAVTSANGYLGYNAGAVGTAIISGAGTKWTNSANLYVGRDGSGTLNIVAGGEISNGNAYLGYNTGSAGTATVSGTGAKWSSTSSLYVGYSGAGTLTVSDGGLVTAATLYATLNNVFGNGSIAVNGAVLDTDLYFDATHGTTQSLPFGTGGTLNLVVNGKGDLGAGYKGSGRLRIADGAAVTSIRGYLGHDAGSNGTATVTGVGTSWTNSSNLYVGYGGSGALTIAGGARLTSGYGPIAFNHGSTGVVTVDGAGSVWTTSGGLSVGWRGNGTLSVINGGVLRNTSSGSYCWVGAKPGATGIAIVDGVGSTWTTVSNFFVGSSGDGNLTISGGGDVSNVDGYIGNNTGVGVVIVRDAGSTWTNSGNFYVGNCSRGTLRIVSGGEVSNRDAYVGVLPGAVGTVEVSGAGARWTTNGVLYLGQWGRGNLSISDGAAVVISGKTFVAFDAGSIGAIEFGATGGTLTTQSFAAPAGGLTGTGTITTRGLVMDANLVFDSNTSLKQTILLEKQPNQHVTINLDMLTPTMNGDLGAGWQGRGALAIRNGAAVASQDGMVGRHTASTGIATIDGPGAKWSISGSLDIGYDGAGTLNVTNGATIATTTSYKYSTIGANAGSIGVVTLDGAGTKWNNSGTIHVGGYGNGTLSVTRGAVITGGAGDIGFFAGSIGVAMVDGTGSMWTISNNLAVGEYGNGTLYLANGGKVLNSTGFVGWAVGSAGTVTVSGTGSRWTNTAALYVGDSGTGTMHIEGGGEVYCSHGGFIGNKSGSTGAVVVNGAGSSWYASSTTLYVAYGGNGALCIEAGGIVNDSNGWVGYSTGVRGRATVSGGGSTWANGSNLYLGGYGNGLLIIEAGGEVSNQSGYLGQNLGSSGVAVVCGAGAKWTNRSDLYVGESGRGELHIADTGMVTAASVSINSQSVLAIDVANDSKLIVNNGTGTITNNGTLRLLAGAGAITSTAYSPIAAANYGNSANLQAIGGAWDAMGHTFTPSSVQPTAAGAPLTMDLATQQRAMVSDGATDWALGESFLRKSASLTATTTAISGATRTSVEQAIDLQQTLRSGWQFTTDSGYATGDPAYLSFDLGAGYARSAISVWRYSGTTWASYDAVDLTYDGRYASFTVTDLNTAGYAIAGTLTRTWTGGAGGDDWSQGANWNNGVALMPTDVVVFDGSARLTPNNDAAGRQVAGLKFAAGAGEFHLGGNALKLAGKIDDQAAAKQEINLPVEFIAGTESGTVNVIAGGELKISQPVSGNQGLTKTGAGTLTLLQDAAYSGNTDVQAGTLVVQGLSNSGSTTVNGTLVVDYIRQDTLTINANGKVQIDPTAAGTSVLNFLSIADGSGGFSWDMGSGGMAMAGVGEPAAPVPEPATWMLVVGGLVVLLAYRLRELRVGSGRRERRPRS